MTLPAQQLDGFARIELPTRRIEDNRLRSALERAGLYRTLALDDDYWDREGVLESESAGDRRTFLRFSFWANLLLRRFLSPGFRKNACFFTSLIMPSCCT